MTWRTTGSAPVVLVTVLASAPLVAAAVGAGVRSAQRAQSALKTVAREPVCGAVDAGLAEGAAERVGVPERALAVETARSHEATHVAAITCDAFPVCPAEFA